MRSVETTREGRYRVGEIAIGSRVDAALFAASWGLHVRPAQNTDQWHWNGASWVAVPCPVRWDPDSPVSGMRRVAHAWATHKETP